MCARWMGFLGTYCSPGRSAPVAIDLLCQPPGVKVTEDRKRCLDQLREDGQHGRLGGGQTWQEGSDLVYHGVCGREKHGMKRGPQLVFPLLCWLVSRSCPPSPLWV